MSFNEIAVMAVFAFLGYLIVSSVQNWMEEKKGKPQDKSGAAADANAPPSQSPFPSPSPSVPPLPAQAGDANRRIFAPGMLKDEVKDEIRDDATPEELPWYEILGVAKGASHEQIVAAYQAKIGEYQPEKMANMPPDIRALAEKRSAEIFAAYERALLVRGH